MPCRQAGKSSPGQSHSAAADIKRNHGARRDPPDPVHDPNHWFYLYTDEGSSFITVRDNWTEADKFLKNANGPGNVWENNGPMPLRVL